MSQAWPVSSALYAVTMEFWAASEVALPACIVPLTMPGPPPVHGAGNPVHAAPGLMPRSPLTTVGPVLVTVEPPRTAKLSAAPRDGATAMAESRPSSPEAGGCGPVGVRSEDLEPHPVCASARAAIRTGIARRRTVVIEGLPSRAPWPDRTFNLSLRLVCFQLRRWRE